MMKSQTSLVLAVALVGISLAPARPGTAATGADPDTAATTQTASDVPEAGSIRSRRVGVRGTPAIPAAAADSALTVVESPTDIPEAARDARAPGDPATWLPTDLAVLYPEYFARSVAEYGSRQVSGLLSPAGDGAHQVVRAELAPMLSGVELGLSERVIEVSALRLQAMFAPAPVASGGDPTADPSAAQ